VIKPRRVAAAEQGDDEPGHREHPDDDEHLPLGPLTASLSLRHIWSASPLFLSSSLRNGFDRMRPFPRTVGFDEMRPARTLHGGQCAASVGVMPGTLPGPDCMPLKGQGRPRCNRGFQFRAPESPARGVPRPSPLRCCPRIRSAASENWSTGQVGENSSSASQRRPRRIQAFPSPMAAARSGAGINGPPAAGT